jgi:predicted TIM-barrel fold metal-dependent hydrolase
VIWDVHVHIGRWLPRCDGRPGDATGDLIERARLHGIDRLAVSSLGNRGYLAHPTVVEVREANDHVQEALAQWPDQLLGYCYVNPRLERTALDEVQRCVVDGPMVGIKLWIACKADDPLVDPVLERAAELGVPVLQHAWYKSVGQLENESTPAQVAAMGRRHPDVTIIMAHLTGAGERGVQDIADVPNVVVDTSGGDPEAGIVEYAVRHLGAERVLFGSDAPGRSFGVQLGKVSGASLSSAERELILGGNAERVLGR